MNRYLLIGFLLLALVFAVRFAAVRAPGRPSPPAFISTDDAEKNIAEWEAAAGKAKNPAAYEKVVAFHLWKNDVKAAEKWALEGLTHFPNCANLAFNLALIRHREGAYAESLGLIESVLARNPYFPNAHYLKGLICEATGRREEAKSEYTRELNVNPGSRKAWEKLKESVHETR